MRPQVVWQTRLSSLMMYADWAYLFTSLELCDCPASRECLPSQPFLTMAFLAPMRMTDQMAGLLMAALMAFDTGPDLPATERSSTTAVCRPDPGSCTLCCKAVTCPVWCLLLGRNLCSVCCC